MIDKSRKRVSFASSLEVEAPISTLLSAKRRCLLASSPGKGILRSKSSYESRITDIGKSFRDKSKKKAVGATKNASLRKSMLKRTKKTKRVVKKKRSGKMDNNIKNDSVYEKANLAGALKRVIRVTRGTKTKLMSMNKKERKDHIARLKKKRHPYFDVAERAKQLWETIRSSKSGKAEKQKCIEALRALVSGKLKMLILAHDTCRVVQCLMSINDLEIRGELFDELTPEIIVMSKSIYAKFFVVKMLKYGSKEQREVVISAFKGHCVNLYKNSAAAKILETIYNDYANSAQRISILREFYCQENILLVNDTANLKTLKEIIEMFPDKKNFVLSNLEEVLTKVVQKETLKHSLTHKLLLDYLSYCSEEQKVNIIESLSTNLPEICHTREGSRAAMLCVWHSDAKIHKVIVKSLSGLAVNSCKDEFARRVLFAIFDTVDDTILVNKHITSQIANNIGDLVFDKYGASVLHYLINPRDARYFGGWITIMNEGDQYKKSKKEPSKRYAELYECVRENLFTFLAANMSSIINSKNAATIVLNALEPQAPSDHFQRFVAEAEKKACFRAIADILGGDLQSYDMEDQPHMLRFGPPRFVFRKLMAVESRQTGAHLSDFIAQLPRDHLSSFITLNCGCYTLIEMLRSGSTIARAAVLDAVNLAALKKSSLPGARVLLEEINRHLVTAAAVKSLKSR